MKKDFYRASPHVGMQEDQSVKIQYNPKGYVDNIICKMKVKKKEWQCQRCNGIFFNKATLSKHLDLCNAGLM